MKRNQSCENGGKQGRGPSEEHAEETDPAIQYLTESYQYHLPSRLIAQEPPRKREDSRLLLLSRKRGDVRHGSFREIGERLREGDLLVVNNSKVFPARIVGKKGSGGRVELLLLQPGGLRDTPPEGIDRGDRHQREWDCLIRASRRPRKGQVFHFPMGVEGEVACEPEEGIWRVRFDTGGVDFFEFLDQAGLTPLPPYIKRNGRPGPPRDPTEDRRRYQTVFARSVGSVAAPTAGFHFSEEMCNRLRAQGVVFAEITLHVGQATFLPVRESDIRDHTVRPERFHVTEDAAESIRTAMGQGRRIVAVGTTVVRCLESVFSQRRVIKACSGWADLYIIPGFRFGVVDALLTNFHLPGSSLLMLVSAFAGTERLRYAYQEAIRNEYRFFSYGDCMLIQ
jgi:S-adenosylmethionine:tRNA ribosyltransferase-isomerase